MGLPFSLAEELKIALLSMSHANGVACDVVSIKNLLKGWFIILHSGATDTDLTLTLYEATDVAAGTNQAVTKVVPIWRDNDAGSSSDVLARVTDADAITIDPATQNGVVAIIEVDPAILTDGYPCVYLVDANGDAANFCTILFVGLPRNAGGSLDAIITD